MKQSKDLQWPPLRTAAARARRWIIARSWRSWSSSSAMWKYPKVTGHDLRRYMADLRQRDSRYKTHPYRESQTGGLSMATIAGHTRAIKRLFGFLVDDGMLTDNPSKALKVHQATQGARAQGHHARGPGEHAAGDGRR